MVVEVCPMVSSWACQADCDAREAELMECPMSWRCACQMSETVRKDELMDALARLAAMMVELMDSMSALEQ